MSRALVVVGDALLDRDIDGRAERLCPEAPVPVVRDASASERPGGAALAAALMALDGHRVTLVTALGADGAGRRLRGLLERRGVAVADLGRGGGTAEKVRVRAAGQVIVRLDREAAPAEVAAPGREVAAAVAGAEAVLVSDYGRGVTASPGLRELLSLAAAPVVWDPHPRGAPPVPGATLLTPNAGEADRMAAGDPPEQARRIRAMAGARAVAVTLGERGAVLAEGDGEPVRVPAVPARGGDTCGAGDRLATAAAAALAAGAPVLEAVRAAVRAASDLVRVGGAPALLAASPGPRAADGLPDRVAAVRAAGGRVVATGGCFDLLHAGHVAMLEAARALGDCLVVLLNSDASVRRLKGSDRPLVEQSDRAAVLGALRCVDAVVVFDEDTPERALARLAPDVWAKGADYAAADLPEAATVEALGGEVVVLPYVAGRSTTRLIEEVLVRAER